MKTTTKNVEKPPNPNLCLKSRGLGVLTNYTTRLKVRFFFNVKILSKRLICINRRVVILEKNRWLWMYLNQGGLIIDKSLIKPPCFNERNLAVCKVVLPEFAVYSPGKGRRAVHIKKKLAIKLEATVFFLGPRRKFLAWGSAMYTFWVSFNNVLKHLNN